MKSRILGAFVAAVVFLVPTVVLGQSAKKHHVLIISLDGMGAEYLRRADEYHLKIPTLRRFMAEGVYAEGVIGVLPTLTYPSHTTMMTGVWPTQHGVFANQKFDPVGSLHGQAITEAATVKVRTLWQAAHDAGYTTASVGFPVTTDASGIDWLMPANVAFEGKGDDGGNEAADLSRHYDHPAGLRETLAPDVEVMGAKDLERRRMAWTIAIMRRYKPDLMTTHLGDLDHAEHATGPFSPESLQALEGLDEKVARLIAEETNNYPDAIVLVVSDHGFLPVEKTFHLNALLHEEGFLNPAQNDDLGNWKAAAWITGGTAAIILKDPHDVATEHRVSEVIQKAANDPKYGIARVLNQQEAAQLGGFPNAALVIEMRPGFKLGAGRVGKVLVDTPHTGTHGYLPQRPELQASFLMMGPGVIHGKNLGVIDMRQIAPTVERLLDLHDKLGDQPPVNFQPLR